MLNLLFFQSDFVDQLHISNCASYRVNVNWLREPICSIKITSNANASA